MAAVACGSGSSGGSGASSGTDGGSDSSSGSSSGDGSSPDGGGIADGGGSNGGDGGTSITGTYGTAAVLPIVSSYWIGMPSNPSEAGGGPFLYFLSAQVTCQQLSTSGWASTLPAGTQTLEVIVGTTTVGATVTDTVNAAPDGLEVNYLTAPSTQETRAHGGSVTLTSYVPGTSVAGTITNVTWPAGGTINGTFSAVYCATGVEL
jgi:hypothetical protein